MWFEQPKRFSYFKISFYWSNILLFPVFSVHSFVDMFVFDIEKDTQVDCWTYVLATLIGLGGTT